MEILALGEPWRRSHDQYKATSKNSRQSAQDQRGPQRSAHMQLFELLSLPPVTERSGEADTGNRRMACRDWIRGVITFCCCVHLAHLTAPRSSIIGAFQSLKKVRYNLAVPSLCARRSLRLCCRPPLSEASLNSATFQRSIKMHDYPSADAKQTWDNNIFSALAGWQCHPSLRMMLHGTVYHVYQSGSLQT